MSRFSVKDFLFVRKRFYINQKAALSYKMVSLLMKVDCANVRLFYNAEDLNYLRLQVRGREKALVHWIGSNGQ